MKKTFSLILLASALFACKSEKLEKTYPAKAYTNEDFNETPKEKNQVLKIVAIDSGKADAKQAFGLTFKDTAINIQDNQRALAAKFKEARFINSQKTAAIVQVEDGSGLVSPFHVVSLKDGNVAVTSLFKDSKGQNDKKYTKGLEEISLSNIIVNNDFVIALVNGTVYPIKRQNETERIQGNYLFASGDKRTLVFLTDNSLYQVDFKANDTVNLPLPASISQAPNAADLIRGGYSWAKNAKGNLFLKQNPDDDRIVDIKEFKN